MARLIAIMAALLLVLAGGCDKSEDNSCKTFSSASGHFDDCTWTSDQADDLCVELGYKSFWGDLETTEDCDATTDVYITRITCCSQ